MEAARTLIDLPERMRRHRFTAELEELRPHGIAYALRQFGGSLDRADAEDVVSEVIIRLDRHDRAGRRPNRLRPAFFQSVKNAGLDLLRYRRVRPVAPLEAAEAVTTDSPSPEDRAEAHQDGARLREAMVRLPPNHREAIALRFGLGMTVPEIAESTGISLPAAKKRVLRSTEGIRRRMEEIEDARFCPRTREIAERLVLGEEADAIGDDAEKLAVEAHLEHCGACRGHLVALRSSLHELGSLALLGGLLSGKLGLAARLASGLHSVAQGAQSGVDRARLASYRAGGAFRAEGADSASLLAGTGQKVAAVCTAGVAGAATCAATGLVGPGIGLVDHQPVHRQVSSPPAHVREAPKPTHHPLVTYTAPTEEAAPEEASPLTPAGPQPRHAAVSKEAEARPKKSKAPEPKTSTPSQATGSQFGIEGEASSGAEPAPVESSAPEPSAPIAEASTVETTTPSTDSSPSSGTEAAKPTTGGGGHDEFGFGG